MFLRTSTGTGVGQDAPLSLFMPHQSQIFVNASRRWVKIERTAHPPSRVLPPSGKILAKFSSSFHSFLRGRAEGRRKSKAGCRRKEIFPQAWVRDLREAYSEASELQPAVGWKPERPRLRPAPLGSGGLGTKVRALVLAGHGFGSRLRRGRTLWTSSLTPSPPPQE